MPTLYGIVSQKRDIVFNRVHKHAFLHKLTRIIDAR
jgi:hypothetical protein